MWVFYSLLTALIESTKDVVSKAAVKKTDEYVTAFGLSFFAALTLLPVLLIVGVPQLGSGYYIGIFLSLFMFPAWSILYMRAVKLSPLSVCMPMLAFNPIFTAIFSIFFDKRFPTTTGWLGITLIAVGLYVLRLNKSRLSRNIFDPILSLKSEPGAVAMLIVALLWSLGTHISKVIINSSSPLMFAFSVTFVGSVGLFVVARIKSKINPRLVLANIKGLGPIGVLHGLSELTFGQALLTGYTPYVAAVKRINIVISSLLGKAIYNESLTKLKLFGIMLMFAGLLCLVLFP